MLRGDRGCVGDGGRRRRRFLSRKPGLKLFVVWKGKGSSVEGGDACRKEERFESTLATYLSPEA
jgi:hypothetical protein